MNLGSDIIEKIYLGSNEITKGYLGADEIYTSVPPIVVQGTSTYENTAGTSSAVINLPAGIVAGELILILIRLPQSLAAVQTPASGFTQVATRSYDSRSYVYKKTAVGGETTATFIMNGVVTITALIYRISDWVEGVEALYGTNNVNDPPSITASWGSKRNLFIATASARRSDNNITGAPTNYGDLIQIANTSSASEIYSRIGAAHRFLESDTDDPNGFTGSGSFPSILTGTIVVG